MTNAYPTGNYESLRKHARAGVYVATAADLGSVDDRTAFSISHFVIVQIAEDNFGWFYQNGFSSATVRVKLEDVEFVLHDIALDIAMFRSWTALNHPSSDNAGPANEIARRKAMFAQGILYPDKYGPVRDPLIAYLPFASRCWTGYMSFDIERYDGIWRDFVIKEISEGTIVASQAAKPDEYILANHPRALQLRRRDIQRKVADLESGVYFLMTNERRAYSKAANDTISMFMSGKKLMRTKVVPAKDINEWIQYSPFIRFFKFVAP